jgi:uncharacterized protein YutE (UPF0331/DUF86 family)
MSDAVLDTLKINLGDLELSLKWLRRSYDRCAGIGIKTNYTEDEYDYFENLTSRYARTVDLLINKTLRSIDTVEFLESGSIIDAVNRAEKRGIIDSVSDLRDLKDLRNEIAHEYGAGNLLELFSKVLAAVPHIFEVTGRVLNYCEQYRS